LPPSPPSRSPSPSPTSTVTPASLAGIDARIADKHLLTHPFYEAWTAGTLPRQALLDYVGQYYAFESNLPRFLTALHSRSEDATIRATLLANAWDEEHGANNHLELWLRFGESLGLDRAQIATAEPNAATKALVDTYRLAAEKAPVEAGIAAIFAYESQLPAVAAAKIEGLKKHFGFDARVDARVDAREGLAFFEVHRTLDVHHAAEERRILEAALADGAGPDADTIVACAGRALDAWWDFLSALYPAAPGVDATGTTNEMSRTASLN
jgi:pyrroloquinoline-quinone synthase